MGSRQTSIIAMAVVVAAVSSAARADTFYIGPSGSNGNSGTSAGSPWGTFGFAIDQLSPGDTLLVLDGTYNVSSQVLWDGGGGTSGNPVNIWAAPGATPVLDFDSMSNSLWGSSSGRGIQIDNGVDWLHIKGLTIQNARDNGLYSESDNSIFEQMVTRWNGDSGMQLDGSSAHNLILNSDSYLNYDPSGNGGDADGFAIKFEDLGPGNVVRGARAWGNSDDGWDFWESNTGGVLVEESWSFDNGILDPMFFTKDALEAGDLTAGNFQGNGNGFKLGHDGGPHVLNRVVAWNNATRGIDVNGNGFGVKVFNSTVYDSVKNWQFDTDTATHILKNNISFDGSSSDDFESADDTFNSWNGIVTLDAADFLSLDDTIARGPRQADGSLPVSDFLRLVAGSDLIDAGTTAVSFVFDGTTYNPVYNGTAPDLGAFEFNAVVVDDFWDAAVNGTWSTGSNWTDGSTPTDSNTANFDVSGSYFVTFDANPDSIRELNVSDGTITFESSGGVKTLAVDSASGSQDVSISDGAALTLGTSGNPLHLTVGGELSVVGASSALTARHGSDLNANGDVLIDQGSIQIGSLFESVGDFNLAAGKTVTIQNGGSLGIVGSYTTPANAVYNVTGSGSEFSTAFGSLAISNGAQVNVSSGGSAGSASAALSVGTSGIGTLNVQGSGATASGSSTVTIGQPSGGAGVLNVGTTTSGAEFSTGSGTATINATGTVNVGSASTSGTFNANGDVTIDGGELNVDELGVFNLAAGKKLTVVDGLDAVTIQGDYTAPADTSYETVGFTSVISFGGDFNLGTAGTATYTFNGGGYLEVDGSLTVGADGQIEGYGVIDAPNDPLRPVTVSGAIVGDSETERITLNGYVQGTGMLDNVRIYGTHAPGSSPAAVDVGWLSYGHTTTLEIEIAGTQNGQFDQVNSSSTIELQLSQVTLDVELIGGFEPIAGHSFDILTAVDQINGEFGTESLPSLPIELMWQIVYDPNVVSLMVLSSALAADFNGDGKVSAADFTVFQDTYGSTSDLRADVSGATYGVPDGVVSDFDYQFWKDNYGLTSGSGSGSGQALAAVPEPGSLALLLLGLLAVALGRRRDQAS